MGEKEFQTEILGRFGKLDDRMNKLEQQNAGIQAILEERCRMREGVLDELRAQVSELYATEHRRKGGKAVWAAIVGGMSAAGALALKMLSDLGGR